jgi:neutral ceramidase
MPLPALGDLMATYAMACEELVLTPRFPPWPSLWMAGYGWGKRGNHGVVARDLFAHCVVIRHGGRPCVLLRVDVAGIPRDVHQAIREQVVTDGTVASADFLISLSHTHSGPQIGCTHVDPYIGMGLDPADVEAVNGSTGLFVELMVELVRTAVAKDTVEVTLQYAEGDVRLGHNRVDLPPVLTRVPVLLARRVDTGDPAAVLFGYACHPVARGNDQAFDSDFCGHAAQEVARRLGVPALYFQGTAGDQEPDWPHDPDQVEVLGGMLADTVLDVIKHGPFTSVTGPISTALVEAALPFAVDLSDPDVVAELALRYQLRFNSPQTTFYARRHAEVMLRLIDGDRLPTSIPMPIQRWRFGSGLTIVALAHEVLAGYDTRIRDLVDDPVWVMAFINEIGCYVPEDETLEAGGALHDGYEAGWKDGDQGIVGDGSNMMVYGWPVPLASTSDDTDPVAPSTQRTVMDAVRQVLA